MVSRLHEAPNYVVTYLAIRPSRGGPVSSGIGTLLHFFSGGGARCPGRRGLELLLGGAHWETHNHARYIVPEVVLFEVPPLPCELNEPLGGQRRPALVPAPERGRRGVHVPHLAPNNLGRFLRLDEGPEAVGGDDEEAVVRAQPHLLHLGLRAHADPLRAVVPERPGNQEADLRHLRVRPHPGVGESGLCGLGDESPQLDAPRPLPQISWRVLFGELGRLDVVV
mmetsp:Transcript_17930/g.41038  ORF Transcript_17930/g.41038 Transcript_17930/m.41038 type:complete len:224 (-) Transcript_17930:468-1139(-)